MNPQWEYNFSGAGTYIVKLGPGTIYQVLLTTSVSGSVIIYDGTSSEGKLLNNTSTTNGSNILIDYTSINFVTGLTIVIIGTNIGKVTVR